MSNIKETKNGGDQLTFNKTNYILMAIGFLAVIIGFFLMSGGGSDDPDMFSMEIFSWRRLTLAPLVVMGGFALVLYAIMKKPRNEA
jgi:hypothetical protein